MNSGMESKYRLHILVALFGLLVAPQLVFADVLDEDINFNVKDALRSDPRVDSFEVTATTSKGIVTLSGSFDNLAAKTYAVAEAMKINGVVAVIDKITVTPGFRWDSDISNAVRRRILNSAVIKSQWLSVACKDGVVTLSGTVGSYSEEEQASLLASEVRGVKEVKNNIDTKWSTKRSDAEIKADVAAALGRDVYMNGVVIDVTVQDGAVALNGSVGNAFVKQRAHDDVRWISHVTDVTNNLNVEWYKDQTVKAANLTPSDESLKKTVRQSLDQDSRLIAGQVTIRTNFGEVTLDGSVFSHYEKGIAEQDAKNVIGVAWVSNNLSVRADQREDWAISDDIDFNLDTDAVTEGFGLGTTVQRGTVTLTGKVHTSYQRSHASDVASRVRGVKTVINNVIVSESNSGTNWKRDSDLVKSIKSRLRSDWTTWWVCDKINVTVTNGVVTLQGDVNSWKQRQEAEDRAFNTFGISEVDNRLSVKGVEYLWDQHYFKLTSF